MLEVLQLEATRSTPEIIFNPANHELSVRGQSYPENSFKFYEPILQWVDTYLQSVGDEKVEIHFCLPYINTSSSKCIMMMLEKFNKAYHDGKNLNLTWFCSEDNDSEIECAEEFQEDLDLPFQIIAQKEV
ncbi:DUF1987 domain-containing protein [Paenibacillus agricola]|uniref:DUF1987 domain-containing protein n=1 Tax=Paenibacillus agricola TaxID=2716264 RepID=A0ABX0J0X2_9BACL|nr:DUF1987 domain-containing protein [Paenibacillus agricola]NHN29110.1 DUF1987 domain-containing protein [Paenibacillus agricola]